MTTHILNYGGGIQTAAICILVAQKRLPKPDCVIVADTGREMPTTWEYADTYMRPLLASVNLELHRAGHELATVDLYAHNGDLLLPVYTETGKLPTFCSGEWKARVVQRYARQVLGISDEIIHWIGFSWDERKRLKGEKGRKYPLLDLLLTRADCEKIVLDAGLPLPKKSRCSICPHQHNEEWKEVKADPLLWADAVSLDHEVRANDERAGLWLHPSRQPLEDVDLDAATAQPAGRQCGLGLCFV